MTTQRPQLSRLDRFLRENKLKQGDSRRHGSLRPSVSRSRAHACSDGLSRSRSCLKSKASSDEGGASRLVVRSKRSRKRSVKGNTSRQLRRRAGSLEKNKSCMSRACVKVCELFDGWIEIKEELPR